MTIYLCDLCSLVVWFITTGSGYVAPLLCTSSRPCAESYPGHIDATNEKSILFCNALASALLFCCSAALLLRCYAPHRGRAQRATLATSMRPTRSRYCFAMCSPLLRYAPYHGLRGGLTLRSPLLLHFIMTRPAGVPGDISMRPMRNRYLYPSSFDTRRLLRPLRIPRNLSMRSARGKGFKRVLFSRPFQKRVPACVCLRLLTS
jgi:hypothetical protein